MMVARSAEIEDEIVRRLSDGEPLRSICRDNHMPGWQRVYEWMAADSDFAGRIAHARELGADAIAEQCLDIADTPLYGEETELDANGNIIKTKTGDMLGHRKLQIETRLKLLSKWQPKKYGDKIQADLNHSGEITSITRRIVHHES